MSIEHQQRALGDLISEAERGTLLLPNFQRDFVWKADEARMLAASLLINIPCGSLLISKGQRKDFAARQVGKRASQSSTAETPTDFLLDGQQRLSVVRCLFSDPFYQDWVQEWDSTFRSLAVRWAVRVRFSGTDPDLFGLSDLKFTGLPPEPDLLTDALISYSVTKTKGFDNWWHPAFMASSSPAERDVKITEGAVADGVAPMWLLTSDESAVLVQALRDIAEQRRRHLFAQYKDGTLDEERFADLLRHGETWSGVSRDDVDERLRDRRSEWVQAVAAFLRDVRSFRFSTIELTSDELPKAIAIYEAINRGGSPLTPFDLVTARFASSGSTGEALQEQLREEIESWDPEIPVHLSTDTVTTAWSPADRVSLINGELTTPFKNQFLQILAINPLAQNPVGRALKVDEIKQQRVLRLSSEQIESGWRHSTRSVIQAWRFLQLRCGIKDEGSLRNKLLILPIAYVLGAQESGEPEASTLNKIEYWYWASVLTDTYTRSQNELAVHDAAALGDWVYGAISNPFKARGDQILAVDGYSSRATLLRQDDERVGADADLYLLQLVLALGGRDILEDRRLSAHQDDLHDHHLIPLGTATTVGQSSSEIRRSKDDETARLLNSPLNRAYILGETNLKIGSRALAQYMNGISDQVKSSLYFSANDSFLQPGGGGDFLAWARGVLGYRFDAIRTAAINRMSALVHS
jgi:hypothetical protein